MQGFELLYLPWEGVSFILRTLSFSGAAGNAVAFLLYVLISLLPIFYLVWKKGIRKKQLYGEDLLLGILSIYTFYLLYAFINPGLLLNRLPAEALNMGAGKDFFPLQKVFCGGLWFSLLASWLLLTLIRGLREKEMTDRKEFLFRGIRILIWTVMLLTLTSVLLSVGGEAAKQMEAIRNNAAGTKGDWLFVGLRAVVTLVPEGFLLGIFAHILKLLKAVQKDSFGTEVIEAAEKLTAISTGTVKASVLCSLLWNGSLFLFAGYLTSVNYSMELSLFPLLMAFASLILTRYFKEAALLREDNEMII